MGKKQPRKGKVQRDIDRGNNPNPKQIKKEQIDPLDLQDWLDRKVRGIPR